MKMLLVKMSSLGDLLHTLPALTDAQREVPELSVDWVVEEGYTQIAAWHPAVREVIPTALRRWRHEPLHAWRSGEWRQFLRRLRLSRYDMVMDAQGLLKSALVARLARGVRYGFDRHSARESLAATAYQHAIPVARSQHAIRRLRELFAAALEYVFHDEQPDYGLGGRFPRQSRSGAGQLVFLHGTTWPSKHWPHAEWQRLAVLACAAGWQIRLPWATAQERLRAERIAAAASEVEVLPASSLNTLARIIGEAAAVVGVDSGLAHLAAALGVPSITLYGATDPRLTGTIGARQRRLQVEYPCAPCLSRVCREISAGSQSPPCYRTLSAERVWAGLRDVLRGA